MEDRDDEPGMDTTYIGILLVVFLAIAALAIDIGYLYVSEEDLQNAAETSALAGAKAIKQRLLDQAKTDPSGLKNVLNDPEQNAARSAAIDSVSGQHKAAALIEIASKNKNKLTDENDLTVGFWNISTHTYTPGGTPVNAIQVRTRRTAENEEVGLGSLGNILAKMSGIQKFNYTPEAISAIPPRANANIAVCVDFCDKDCRYPNICSIPERKMIRDPWDPRKDPPAINRYAYTTLQHQVTDTTKLSDLVCMDLPPQEACGRQIFTIQDPDDSALRDIESMMYNTNIDSSNKEYDQSGKLVGWWVIAPVTDCPPAKQENVFEQHAVTRYALIRISRICVNGASGCQQNGTSFKAPPSTCNGVDGLYIDRISCVNCGSKALQQFPGLHPVLVR
jgi:hypothetical protein